MIESVYSYSNNRRTEGFEAELTDNIITIKSGSLIVGDSIQDFEETIFELDTTDHIVYDLYIVQGDDNRFLYHLDKTYMDTGVLPSYAGKNKLFHMFMNIETSSEGVSGYVVYLKHGEQNRTIERKKQTVSRRSM